MNTHETTAITRELWGLLVAALDGDDESIADDALEALISAAPRRWHADIQDSKSAADRWRAARPTLLPDSGSGSGPRSV
ncbi:hypothetical protein Arub01_41750 [Actinomadura rubrobrunea]|uniref:Uncharacterized protein n=1 Tax=Actinomadura rubrobrunea TaxID=115335 RepID=A0A9W6PZS7_9ACTN|nr:hypothetical protein Arub01_41750 [Actinomadura rubrobrunea]